MPLHPEMASVVERRGRAGGSGRRREENSGAASRYWSQNDVEVKRAAIICANPLFWGRAAIIFATLALLPGATGKGEEDLELVLSFHNRYHPTCTSDEGWPELAYENACGDFDCRGQWHCVQSHASFPEDDKPSHGPSMR